MEQLTYSVPPSHRGAARPGSVEYLRLLEARLRALEALAENLVTCRSAFVSYDLTSFMQWVQSQSAHCSEIQRLERELASVSAHRPQSSFLSSDEAEWAKELSRRIVGIKRTIHQLNRTYAELVRKAAYNNGVLRNLYATALVYADPRLGPEATRCGKAEV